MSTAKTKAPKAIILDCYNTLFANNPEDWITTFADIADEQNIMMSGEDLWRLWKLEEVQFRERRTNLEHPEKSPPFQTYREAWTECFLTVFRETKKDADADLAALRCVEHMAKRPIFSDAVEVLTFLRKYVKLGLFSNADDAFLTPLILSEGIEFDVIASSESARVYKPASKAFHTVLTVLGIEPQEAWYVGDHFYDDVVGAGLAGLTPVWIRREGMPLQSIPNKWKGDYKEISSLTALSYLLSDSLNEDL